MPWLVHEKGSLALLFKVQKACSRKLNMPGFKKEREKNFFLANSFIY